MCISRRLFLLPLPSVSLYQSDRFFLFSALQTSFPSASCPSISRLHSYSEQHAVFRVAFYIFHSCTGFPNRCELSHHFLYRTSCMPPLLFSCKVPFSCSCP